MEICLPECSSKGRCNKIVRIMFFVLIQNTEIGPREDPKQKVEQVVKCRRKFEVWQGKAIELFVN